MEYQKTAEATGHLIGNKTADKITKKLQQNNSKINKNEHDEETSNKTYISPEERQKIIGNLRLT